MRDDAMTDAALDELAAYGPDLSNGLTSHAPMVVEALAALGPLRCRVSLARALPAAAPAAPGAA
jgi:hypothetical protein